MTGMFYDNRAPRTDLRPERAPLLLSYLLIPLLTLLKSYTTSPGSTSGETFGTWKISVSFLVLTSTSPSYSFPSLDSFNVYFATEFCRVEINRGYSAKSCVIRLAIFMREKINQKALRAISWIRKRGFLRSYVREFNTITRRNYWKDHCGEEAWVRVSALFLACKRLSDCLPSKWNSHWFVSMKPILLLYWHSDKPDLPENIIIHTLTLTYQNPRIKLLYLSVRVQGYRNCHGYGKQAETQVDHLQ